MALTVLITEAQFKAIVSSWSKQIDYLWFSAAFQIAQDIYIEPILGKNLNDELLTQFNSNTLTPDNQTLLEYVQKALAWRIAEKGVINHNAHVVNVGVTTVSGGFHSAAPDQKAINLLKEYGGYAHVYSMRLTEYLSKNQDLYPLWKDHNKRNAIENVKGQDGGVYFRRGIRARFRRC